MKEDSARCAERTTEDILEEAIRALHQLPLEEQCRIISETLRHVAGKPAEQAC